MLSDIEIAQNAKMKDISEIASMLGIDAKGIEPYGHYKAKISNETIESLKDKEDGKLVLRKRSASDCSKRHESQQPRLQMEQLRHGGRNQAGRSGGK